jgi:hypothetical protein
MKSAISLFSFPSFFSLLGTTKQEHKKIRSVFVSDGTKVSTSSEHNYADPKIQFFLVFFLKQQGLRFSTLVYYNLASLSLFPSEKAGKGKFTGNRS